MELGKVFLPQFSNEQVKAFSVNGCYVRAHIYLDFTEDGHDLVYGGGGLSLADFIPQGELWLDDANRLEWVFIAIHALEERYQMSQGMEYGQAHTDYANPIEQEARNNPERAGDILRETLAKQP